MKIRSDSFSLQYGSDTQKNITGAKYFRGPSRRVREWEKRKAVFHRKKVVQLSLNNHCHAILKNSFFCFSPDDDSCGLVFPPFFIPSIKMMSEHRLWVAGGKIQNAEAPFFSFHVCFFFPFSFILLNHEKYPITQIFFFQHVSTRQLFSTKLFSLKPSVDPKEQKLELINFVNR